MFGVLAALALVTSRARAAVATEAGGTVAPRWPTPSTGLMFDDAFRAADVRWGLPPGMTSRVAWQESRYDPGAVSPAGAVGLMGIVPKWHPTVDAWDPWASINYGAGYLRQNFDRFGTWRLALAAYNAGPGNVEKYGGIPPFPETVQYVASIGADLGLP